MANRAAARQAKTQLSARLAGRSWLRGIGLEGSGDAYRVRVNVEQLTPEITNQIPSQVEGVDVAVKAVGQIRSLPATDAD